MEDRFICFNCQGTWFAIQQMVGGKYGDLLPMTYMTCVGCGKHYVKNSDLDMFAGVNDGSTR